MIHSHRLKVEPVLLQPALESHQHFADICLIMPCERHFHTVYKNLHKLPLALILNYF